MNIFMYVYIYISYTEVYPVVAVVGRSGRAGAPVSVGPVPWWCGVVVGGSSYGYIHGPGPLLPVAPRVGA